MKNPVGRRSSRCLKMVLLAVLASLGAIPALGLGGTASTTTLAATSGGGLVTTVAHGAVVTLTATVISGGGPVSPGQVKFCDASATYCEDSHLLGIAQLTAAGTATFRFVPAIGAHSYRAVFVGTAATAGSMSIVSALSVSGLYPTTTTIAASGSEGNYTLTATAVGIGTHAFSPTGTVSFLDTTNGNSVLGLSALGSATAALSFSSGPSVPVYSNGEILADFNGDGHLDIAAVVTGGSTSQPNSISVLLAQGDGTYVQAATLSSTVPANFLGVVSADFNGDGKPDLLAWTNSATDAFQVFLGNGDGTFVAAPNAASLGSVQTGAVVGDFNGDGIEDVAFPSGVLLGNGDGTFSAQMPMTLPSGIGSCGGLFAADFTGDGKLDLVASCESGGNQPVAVLLLGNGDGSFNATILQVDYDDVNEVGAVADFNGDGIPDLLIQGGMNPAIPTRNPLPSEVVLGKGDGTFGQSAVSGFPDAVNYGTVDAAVDLNGDGFLDLLEYDPQGMVGNAYMPYAMVAYLGNGDGSFQSNPIILPAVGNNGDRGFAVGDLNGDGLPDVIVLPQTDSGDGVVEYNQLTETATATVTGISAPVLGVSNLVEASYPGDTNFAASTSATVGLAAKDATTLTLTASPTAVSIGQQITLTATLSPYTAAGFSTNGEAVSFTSGGQALGTGTLANGVATLKIATTAAGSIGYAATYAGDSNFGASSGNLSYVVTVAPTTLGLSVSPLGTTVGQSVTLTATLSPVSVLTTSSNGEQVTFYSGTVSLGTGTLANGVATLATTSLAAALDSLTAQYAGDTVLGASTSPAVVDTVLGIPAISFTVPSKVYGAAPFTVAATSNSTGAISYSVVSGPATISGSTLTLTGAGTVSLEASQAATGADIAGTQTASFAVAPAPLAVAASNAARVFGAANPAFAGTVTGAVNGDTFVETFATAATASSPVGGYPIVPSVTGTKLADYQVTSTPGTLTVTQAGTSTTLALSNGNLTMTATVLSLTTGTPTGTVSFYQGQTAVGQGTLSGGVATYTATSFPAGDAVLSAQYSGDANFTESQSPPILLLGVGLGAESLTVGQSGSVSDALTVTVAPGYVGTVSFSCAGLPANASCSFTPASVAFSGSNVSAQGTLTISTGVSAEARLESQGESAGVWAAGLLGPGLLGLAFRRRNLRLRGLPMVLVLCGLGIGLAACGGPGPLSTPAGTTTVQVVATGPAGLSQASNLTLTVH